MSDSATAIIQNLTDQANEILAAVLHSTPLQPFAVTSKGNMPYYWQNPSNLEFNAKTYAWIASALAAGDNPIQLDQVFTNEYIQVLSKVQWSLSSADQAKLNTYKSNATDQQGALLGAWKSAYGSLPDGTGQPIDLIAQTITSEWADPPTTLTALQDAINPNALLNNVPAAGGTITPVFFNWLNALGEGVSLENNITMNNAYVKKALAAAQSPSTTNGGLTLDSGDTVPAFAVATQLSDILNGLKTGAPVELDMTVTRSTENEFKVTASGGLDLSIPVLDFLGVDVGGKASYFQDDIATTDNQVSVSMTFPGVTLVNFGPVDFNESTLKNWYWMTPITDAIKNGDSDVSGYKFSPDPQVDFSDNGPFAYLQGAAICDYPTVTITVVSSNYASIQKTFEQSASVGLSFLGINLGIGGSESTYSNSVEVDASTQTIKITLAPPQELVAGNSVDSEGWVLGVQTKFPAAT